MAQLEEGEDAEDKRHQVLVVLSHRAQDEHHLDQIETLLTDPDLDLYDGFVYAVDDAPQQRSVKQQRSEKQQKNQQVR